MSAYYNEIDPFAAAWLRELIKAKVIADGEVDERDIRQVEPSDLEGFTQCHWFAGIGTWSYALRNAGWADDLRVWTGSCPCQSFSASGKRNGFSDQRHLWPAWFRLIRELRPEHVFGEQVASKDGLAWFDVVSSDLEGEVYAVGACDTCAAGFGAPHIRQRLFFVADACNEGLEELSQQSARQKCPTVERNVAAGYWQSAEWLWCRDGKYRPVESGTFPLAHGTPNRVGRLRGYGNALCAPQAQAFIEAYLETGK